MAVSDNTVTQSGCTSRMPPATKTNSSLPSAISIRTEPGLDAGDQRCVARIDAEFAGFAGQGHEPGLTREDRFLGTDNINRGWCSWVQTIFLAFSKASSIVPTM
jgi:hypothetical protein